MKILLVLCFFGLGWGSIGSSVSDTDDETAPLVAEKSIDRLRGVVEDLAKLGLEGECDELRALLLGLGDTEEEHLKRAKKWSRALERAKPNPKQKTLDRVAREVEKLARLFERELGEGPKARTQQIADAILVLDSNSEAAHSALVV